MCLNWCSSSSLPGSLMWLEGKWDTESTGADCAVVSLSAFYCPWRFTKPPGEKLRVKSWVLMISGLPSPFQTSVSWPAEFELGCNLKPNHTRQLGCKPHHSTTLQSFGRGGHNDAQDKLLVNASYLLTLQVMRGVEGYTCRRSWKSKN